MKIDHEAKTITFRQSWLNDYLLCPERTRRSMLEPDLFTSDAEAILGTGMHSYAELRLHGEDRDVALAAAFNAVDYELSLPHTNIKRNDDGIYSMLPAMCASWEADIFPLVKPGGESEVKFKVKLGEWCGYEIWLSGMIDYLEPDLDVDGKIWDWKTAGQEYKAWEKSRWAVQPTTYATGAVLLGKATWPVRWSYGVVLKSPMKRPKTQVVSFTRHAGHADWLLDQITSILEAHATEDHLTNAYTIPPDPRRGRAWPKNDQHALCSEKWCPVYATCKGAYVDI